MKIFSLVMTLAALTFSVPALAQDCPVGGSEHSVGLPGPGDAHLALRRFEESAAAQGARDLLLRHGFCPVDYGPAVELVEHLCDAEDSCRSLYSIDMHYRNPSTNEERTVSGTLRTATWNSGPTARGIFSMKDLGIDGIGNEVVLDDAQSELFMTAMQDAGVEPDQIVMGALNLVAGRIECSRVVYPNAPTSCAFQFVNDSLPVADGSVAAELHEALIDLGALVQDGRLGSSRTDAAMITCSRGVYPNAVAGCTLVIED